MKKHSLIFGIIFICGCASTHVALSPKVVSSIKTIAVVSESIEKDPNVFDYTKVRNKTYTGGQHGALGGLIEGLILAGEASLAVKQSLGESPEFFKKALRGYVIQDDLQNRIQQKISEGFAIVDSGQLKDKLGQSIEGEPSIKDYLKAAQMSGAEALTYFRYRYGIAAYADDMPSALVCGDLFIYDVPLGKLILRKKISSEEVFREGYDAEEFRANEAYLFKRQIDKAIEGASLLIASEWHLSRNEVEKRRSKNANSFSRHDINAETMSIFSVSCNNPVKLTQSCSALLGARKKIEIDSKITKIAGSADGKAVLVMGGKGFQLISRIKKILNSHGLTIERAVQFGSSEIDSGYILYADGDAYSLLEKYAKTR